MSEDDQTTKKQPTGPKKWLRSIVINVGVIVVFLIGADYFRSSGHLKRGTRAPGMHLTSNVSSDTVTLPTAGKSTILYFSAPWCGVCSLTGQSLQTAASWLEYLGFDLENYEVSLSYDSIREVNEYVKKGGKQSVLLGTDQIQQDYLVEAFPTFYFLDKEGKVRWTTVGFTTAFGLIWRFIVYL